MSKDLYTLLYILHFNRKRLTKNGKRENLEIQQPNAMCGPYLDPASYKLLKKIVRQLGKFERKLHI